MDFSDDTRYNIRVSGSAVSFSARGSRSVAYQQKEAIHVSYAKPGAAAYARGCI